MKRLWFIVILSAILPVESHAMKWPWPTQRIKEARRVILEAGGYIYNAGYSGDRTDTANAVAFLKEKDGNRVSFCRKTLATSTNLSACMYAFDMIVDSKVGRPELVEIKAKMLSRFGDPIVDVGGGCTIAYLRLSQHLENKLAHRFPGQFRIFDPFLDEGSSS